MTQRLYVGNLSYQTTEQELRAVFGKAGEVSTVDVISDKFTGQGKGFAFVEMATDEGTQAALNTLNGSTVDDRTIVVNVARAREDKPKSYGR
ncbi:MAG: RNA recognition motif domain-containing protein [Chloroflexia bacterium]